MPTISTQPEIYSKPSLMPTLTGSFAPKAYGSEGEYLVKETNRIKRNIKEVESLKNLLLKKYYKKEEELFAYINELRIEVRKSSGKDLSEDVLDKALKTWEKLKRIAFLFDLYLEIPDASPGLNNNFMFVWSNKEHYFECEIFDNGQVEFFYKNRKSKMFWGEDTNLEERFPLAVLAKASLFGYEID